MSCIICVLRRKSSNRRSLESENDDLELLRKKVKVFTPVEPRPSLTDTKLEPSKVPECSFSLPVFRVSRSQKIWINKLSTSWFLQLYITFFLKCICCAHEYLTRQFWLSLLFINMKGPHAVCGSHLVPCPLKSLCTG